jgi:hypothetical protein
MIKRTPANLEQFSSFSDTEQQVGFLSHAETIARFPEAVLLLGRRKRSGA